MWLYIHDLMSYAWCPKFLEHRLFPESLTDLDVTVALENGSHLLELNQFEKDIYAPEKFVTEDIEALREEGVKDLRSYQQFESNIFWGNGYQVPLISRKLKLVGYLDNLMHMNGEWVVLVNRSFGRIHPSFRLKAVATLVCLREMGFDVKIATVSSPLQTQTIHLRKEDVRWLASMVALTRAMISRKRADVREVGDRACKYCPHLHCDRKDRIRQVDELPEGWSDCLGE